MLVFNFYYSCLDNLVKIFFIFFRAASYPESFKEGIVFSPAEGIVVYNKSLQKKEDILICKSDEFYGKRLFKIEQFLKKKIIIRRAYI